LKTDKKKKVKSSSSIEENKKKKSGITLQAGGNLDNKKPAIENTKPTDKLNIPISDVDKKGQDSIIN
jgi:hypothetical protein